MNYISIYLTLLIWMLFWGDSLELRMIKVMIPSYKYRGESAELQCQYELNGSTVNRGYHKRQRHHYMSYDSNEHQNDDEGEKLYTVKWYKDNEEFYRFTPRANPQQHSYKVDGIRVDHDLSDSFKVVLRNLTLKQSGLYRCEISAEAPNFSSVQGEQRMEVVYLPRYGPNITGEQTQYAIGDKINLSCSSGRSHPASILQWYINDEPVHDPSMLIRYPETIHTHGLIVTTLGLTFTVDATQFRDGEMRVKCVASLSPVIWKGNKESIVRHENTNRVAMLLVRSSTTRLKFNGSCGLLLFLFVVIQSIGCTSFTL